MKKLHQNIEEYRDVDLSENSKMPLGQWLDRWLEEYAAPSVRSSTLEGYRGYIERNIKPYLGDKPVGKVTREDVQKLHRELQKNGRKELHSEYGYQLSGATIRRIHGVFHQAMDVAVRENLIARNPAEGITLPKKKTAPKQILNDAQLERFLEVIQADSVWHDFFYTELITGLRQGEICGLMWSDFDEAHGTLSVRRTLHIQKGGRVVTGETKTGTGKRTITLPPSMAGLLAQRKKHSYSQWIVPNPLRPEQPASSGTAYNHLKTLLKRAGLPSIRVHDLRHTFAIHALASGVDAKTLSGILGHTQASFTLNTYTHITDEMRRKAALSIDQGITKAEVESMPEQTDEHPKQDLVPVEPPRRRPGTGCVSQLREHLWEGRYSPVWPDGKKHSRNVYAKTREECEEKLKVLILEMKAEIAALRSGASTEYPDGVSPKKKAIAAYLREHPGVSSKSLIARELQMDRSTVQRYYDEIQEEFQRQG
ncbi:site-specific integrase [Intestinimonas aquisgranensis]|nr:site-specific integrase [Intestinimonas aquisgranensis]